MHRSARLVRSAPLTAALLLLTVLGHTAASGQLPPPTALGLVAVAGFALTFAVADRRRGALWLTGYLIGAQLLLHAVLSIGAHHGGTWLPSTSMLAAHALAGVLAALVFAHGEGLAARWLAYLASVLGAPSLHPIACFLAVTAPPSDSPARIHLLLVHHLVRRGPPALAA